MKQWCCVNNPDDGIYSAVVNCNGNYGISDNVYLSVPVKFDNGEFFFITNYKFGEKAQSALDEILLVNVIIIIQ